MQTKSDELLLFKRKILVKRPGGPKWIAFEEFG